MSATPAPAAPASVPNPDHVLRLAAELNVKVFQVAATAQLLAEGATVPFIARYRKEATGELDEVQVLAVRAHVAATDGSRMLWPPPACSLRTLTGIIQRGAAGGERVHLRQLLTPTTKNDTSDTND